MKWNYIIKKTIVVFLIFSTCLNLFAQDEISNLKKYWYYRNRLKYFVYPGTERGESIIATMRNNWRLEDNIDRWDFIQITENPLRIMGYYIGMLATEYKLLSDNNQNTTNTYNELKLANSSMVQSNKSIN